MIDKPRRFSTANGAAFQDVGVVESYQYRPPYPPEIFDILAGLINAEPRHVLDVGCGTGNIARRMVEQVERVDAVDFSYPMIEQGKRLSNGDHPGLRWLHGPMEDIDLDPPYALITAGESLHWMDWNIVLPRFSRLLTAGGSLAIVAHDTVPDPWSILGELVMRYRTDGGYAPSNMIDQLQEQGLFQKVGAKELEPVPFEQTVDHFIESYHSRSGFSRERMGQAQAKAFDQEARAMLLGTYHDGIISFQVEGSAVWGLPKG